MSNLKKISLNQLPVDSIVVSFILKRIWKSKTLWMEKF